MSLDSVRGNDDEEVGDPLTKGGGRRTLCILIRMGGIRQWKTITPCTKCKSLS